MKDEHLKLDPDKTYRLVFNTNCGDFTVTLDQKRSPNATGSLVSLAQRGFFDDTFFHRIVPGFVIQGGDPTGKGTGGPGY
jgi:cyclophilin family peptidyl-prolyl cis-trans isomerase